MLSRCVLFGSHVMCAFWLSGYVTTPFGGTLLRLLVRSLLNVGPRGVRVRRCVRPCRLSFSASTSKTWEDFLSIELVASEAWSTRPVFDVNLVWR